MPPHGSSIKILTEVLGLVNPAAFSRTQSVTRYVKHVVSELRLPDAWRFETAAMLSQLGCVTVHPETMEAIFAGLPVSQDDQTRFARHPIVARQLLEGIPRLEYVAALDRATGRARACRSCGRFDECSSRYRCAIPGSSSRSAWELGVAPSPIQSGSRFEISEDSLMERSPLERRFFSTAIGA